MELKARQPVPRPLLAELRCAPAASPAARTAAAPAAAPGAPGRRKPQVAAGVGAARSRLASGIRNSWAPRGPRGCPGSPCGSRDGRPQGGPGEARTPRAGGGGFLGPYQACCGQSCISAATLLPPPQLQSPLSRLPSAVRK